MSFSPLNNASMTSVKMTGMINGSSQPATPPYVAMSASVGSLSLDPGGPDRSKKFGYIVQAVGPRAVTYL